jgi:hypothetical protein
MKDDNDDILGHEVDTKGRIESTSHTVRIAESSVSQHRALEGLPRNHFSGNLLK